MATFDRSQFVVRSTIHYWRTNLAVMLGVMAGTSVIVGALIVGDSVKSSLRQMTLNRLGQIDFALSGSRFVREELAAELGASIDHGAATSRSGIGSIAPAIIMQAGLQSSEKGTIRRASQVNVYGFDQKGWSLIKTGEIAIPGESGVVLNARAAEAVNARVGDQVTLWIELPSVVPRDTLMGKKDNDSQEVTLTVSAIAPDQNGLGSLGLLPTQAMPLNAFVDLHVLQERLDFDTVKPSRRDPIGKPARVNALLAHDPQSANADPRQAGKVLSEAICQTLSLSDLNLRFARNENFRGIVLDSEQMLLEDKLVAAAQRTADEMKLTVLPTMVYLANKIWNPKVYEPGKRPGYSMYSTVAGIDLLSPTGTALSKLEFIGAKPESLGENDIIINEFLATDLKADVGDSIRFTYHTVGSRGELPELEQSVTVRGIVKMTGTAIDRSLTPEVKGITDVDSLADWDQPFPMDLDAVTPRDDEYWDSYRAIPKMFLPLATARRLWPSRYGSLTSLRIAESNSASQDAPASKRLSDDFTTRFLKQINPVELGLAFQPVKAIGLAAANGSTDFSGLFFGFSLFLIVAAMILIGLLFRLGIEQRVRDLGLLGAIGFTSREVARQMLAEGMATALAGAFLGIVVGIGYAQLMIYGLTHWWIGAIGTSNLHLAVKPTSLAIGFVIALFAALISIWWALRQLKFLSLREQLAGVTEKPADLAMQQLRVRRNLRRAVISLCVVVGMAGATATGLIPTPGGFFGIGVLLLVALLSLFSAWLRGEKGLPLQGRGGNGLGRLAIRNASRQRQRTVMTAGMIATATFLIVTVAAFRRDPTSELPKKSSGNGGYTLVAETTSPILYDINTAEGRKKLQLSGPDGSPTAQMLSEMNVVPIRVKPGEDASCLNLYQTKVPTILGVPQSLIEDNRFAFASGSWNVLNQHSDDAIPVIGDMNTLMFSLHKQVGQSINIPSDESPLHRLAVKGMLQDSVFQGVLVMSEENFLKLFPEQKGFRYFLIEVPLAQAKLAESTLETELTEYGFDAEPVADRLARFLSVQNTYLSTFQTLGGLGLLLGTFGLATVMLRNILERQSELALLRAVGFRKTSVALLVLFENASVLFLGLFSGLAATILAIVMTTPGRLFQDAILPWGSLTALLLTVFITGMLAAIFAVLAAIRLPIVTTLRGE